MSRFFKQKKQLYTVLLPLAGVSAAAILVACSGTSSPFPIPTFPAAKSAIVAPELGAACPITNSSIESLVTKGTGLAFSGASFGSVGTYTYVWRKPLAKSQPMTIVHQPLWTLRMRQMPTGWCVTNLM